MVKSLLFFLFCLSSVSIYASGEISQKSGQDTLATSRTPLFWKGQKFIFLEKPRLFQSYGYELYTVAVWKIRDKKMAKKNRSIGYKPFVNKILTIQDVCKIDGDEYGISATIDDSACVLYGVTTHGSILGLAAVEDMATAQKRWKIASTLFSRQRSVQIFDTISSTFKSIKVSLTEPLIVRSISWGMAPLPPQPLWVHVETANGVRGFIPTRVSWTNVATTINITSPPWLMEIVEKNLAKQYPWDKQIWQAIDNHSIIAGMNPMQVRLSWGEPVSIQKKEAGGEATARSIRYQYPNQTLVFIHDSLIIP
ncbi:MAG: hypothetical protein JW795_04800 [Chitinivibrionales bacterium]|nr:hypothetical protein [Chitinivibrionales bacterium]